jgi:hypothetical protein
MEMLAKFQADWCAVITFGVFGAAEKSPAGLFRAEGQAVVLAILAFAATRARI